MGSVEFEMGRTISKGDCLETTKKRFSDFKYIFFFGSKRDVWALVEINQQNTDETLRDLVFVEDGFGITESIRRRKWKVTEFLKVFFLLQKSLIMLVG